MRGGTADPCTACPPARTCPTVLAAALAGGRLDPRPALDAAHRVEPPRVAAHRAVGRRAAVGLLPPRGDDARLLQLPRRQPRLPADEPGFDALSHGEPFLAVLRTRFTSPGFYCLDEPESGLSFSAQVALVSTLHEIGQAGGQVLFATHSPLLAAIPGAHRPPGRTVGAAPDDVRRPRGGGALALLPRRTDAPPEARAVRRARSARRRGRPGRAGARRPASPEACSTSRTGRRRLPVPDGPPGGSRCATRSTAATAGGPSAGSCSPSPPRTQDSRPAAWRSADGTTWEALPVTATTYWGRRAVLSGVACSGDAVVAIGARSGGAHGNPRVTTFFEKDGGLDDQRAPFNLYGGATATNVGPDHRRPPGLADHRQPDQRAGRVALHRRARLHHRGGRAGPRRRGGPHLPGAGRRLGRRGSGWSWAAATPPAPSTASRSSGPRPTRRTWERHEVPRQRRLRRPRARVVATDDGPGRAGAARGPASARGCATDDGWEMASDFGSIPESARAAPSSRPWSPADRGLWATTSDGAAYALWHSDDGDEWAGSPLPADRAARRRASTCSRWRPTTTRSCCCPTTATPGGSGSRTR